MPIHEMGSSHVFQACSQVGRPVPGQENATDSSETPSENMSVHSVLSALSAVRLPAMPQILARLLALCQDDSAGMAELAELIRQESAMVQRILSVANSSAYSYSGSYRRLESALMTMGTDMVRMLVINETVFQNFRALSRNIRFDQRAFWYHALATAMFAHYLAEHMGYAHTEDAYLAGLLHDAGRLALMTIAPEEYASLFYHHDDEALCIQEQHSLSISHPVAGAWLALCWKLDPAIAESIERHHETFDSIGEAMPLVRIIHLACRMAYCEEESPMAGELASRYGLDPVVMTAITSRVGKYVQQAADYLGIDLSGIAPLQSEKPAQAPPSESSEINREILSLLNSAEFGRFFILQDSLTHLQNAAILAACSILELNHALLFLDDPEKGGYECVAADAALQKIIGLVIASHANSMMRRCIESRQPVFLSVKDELAVPAERNVALLMDGSSHIMIPLADATISPGLLFGSLDTPSPDNIENRERLLKNFAQQFVFAWQHLQKT